MIFMKNFELTSVRNQQSNNPITLFVLITDCIGILPGYYVLIFIEYRGEGKMFLGNKISKAITLRLHPVKLPLSYWVLVFLRFILTALPQKGYIHPDEFFQNVEVVAGDVFAIDVSTIWEFDPKFPVRNIFLPKIILGPPLHFIRYANMFTKPYANIDLKTPYFLLVLPRLFICLLSLVNDYCLYKICVIYGQNFRNRLKILASSYVVIVYCCRSFSNSFETLFFSLLLYLVAECMSRSDQIIYHDEFLAEKHKKDKTPVEKVNIFILQNHLPAHSMNRVLVISTLVVLGVFNRPTFVGFAIPPIFFWLHRGLGSQVVGFKDLHLRMLSLVVCSLPAALILIIVDSAYYGYLTLADIDSRKVSWGSWVLTPLNFLRYNTNTKNLARHGLHPRWLHLAVNVPLLFNVLGGLAAVTLVSHVYRFTRGHYSKLPRIQSITGLMLLSIIVPLGLLSMFPHQEARFIIPVILPLVYLYGNQLYSNETDKPHLRKFKNLLLSSWYTLNVLFTLFYGFVHQAGIYQFTNNLHYKIKSSSGVQTHVVTTHSYSIPTYLLQLDSTSKIWTDTSTGHKYRLSPSTFISNYGSMPSNDLLEVIDSVLTDAEMTLHTRKKKYRIYVASPCALEQEIQNAARKYYYFNLVEEASYFPHYCTEALPTFPSNRDQHCLKSYNVNRNVSQAIDLNIFERISCFVKRFCFKVYRVRAMYKSGNASTSVRLDN